MSKALPADHPFAACPQCGATFQPGSRYCWLCGGPRPAVAEAPVLAEAVNEKAPATDDELNPWLMHGTIWAVFIVVLIVGYGVIRAQQPFLATAYVIAVVPAVLVTLIGSVLRRAAGIPWDPAEKVFVFASTIGLTALVGMVLAAVVAVAAIVALFQMCFESIGPR